MNYERYGRWLINAGWFITAFFGLEFILKFNNLSFQSDAPAMWAQSVDIAGGFAGTLVALIGVFVRTLVNRVTNS